MACAGIPKVGEAKNLRFQFLPDGVQEFGEGGIVGALLGARAKPMHIPHRCKVFFDNADQLVWHDASKSPLFRRRPCGGPAADRRIQQVEKRRIRVEAGSRAATARRVFSSTSYRVISFFVASLA
jgi:hypothetical protein